MKKGKLLLAFAAIALVLTGCSKDKDSRTPEQKVDAAMESIKNEWKANKYAETGVTKDFELSTSVNGISGVTISYTSNNDAVRISEDNKTAIVTRPEHTEEDALVTLTAKFVCEDITKNTNLGVMVLKKTEPVSETSVKEIQETKDGEVVSMTGIVVARSVLDSNYNNFTAYVQHETEGGLYIYRAPGADYSTFAIGNKVKVTGTKATYNGLYQIAANTTATWEVELIAENQTLPAYKDITDAVKNAEDNDNAKVSSLFQASLVQLTGFRVTNVQSATISNGTLQSSFNVTGMVGNTETVIRVKYDVSEAAALASDFQGFTVGDILTVKGVGDWFYEFQLVPLAVEKTGHEDFTDQDKVDMAAESFKFNTTSVTSDFKLSLTADHDVTVSWTSDNAAIAIDGENATVTRGGQDVVVTLTATFKLNNATATKTFEVTVVGTSDVEATTVLTRESLFADITSSSYADHNGDYVVNGYTVTTSQVMGQNNSNSTANLDALQFQKQAGTITVKNISVTTVTLVGLSTYGYQDNFTIKLGDNVLTPTVTTENMGVNNSSGYEFKQYTLTITLDFATTGDLVISAAADYAYASYVTSITIA